MGQWTYSIADELRAIGHDVDTWFDENLAKWSRGARSRALLAPWAVAGKLAAHRREFDVAIIHEPIAWISALHRVSRSGFPAIMAVSHGIESRVFGVMRDAANRGYARVSWASRVKAPLLRLWQADLGLTLADQVICLSTLDEEYSRTRLRIPANRITRIVNGAPQIGATSRQAYTLGKCRVLFVGGWLDIKGKRTLPRIWTEVRKRVPNATLTLVGTGATADHVELDFPSLDRGSIRVVPRITNRSQMESVVAEHDIFLMPSISEASPLSLLEAMSSGLAIAASRVGGIPDIARDGVDGLLFDPMNAEQAAIAVARLCDEPTLASTMIESAIERARTLTWSRAASQIASAAERIVGPSAVVAKNGGTRVESMSHRVTSHSADEQGA